jgi:peptidoglycan/LPS O-acetylase OafA/YrhL
VQSISRHDVKIAFVGLAILSWMVIWWAFVQQPRQIALELDNPLIAQGTLGRDPEGVWFDGNTQIAVNRFDDTQWRHLQWRWRQATDAPLAVQVQFAPVQLTTPVTTVWRTVHLLMPRNPARLPLEIQSATMRVPNDSRDLGVIMSVLQVKQLLVTPWRAVALASDYWILLMVAGIWLWRGRWVGVVAFAVICVVYGAMVLQEIPLGFASPSLWLDRTSRYILCGLMVVFAVAQRYRQVTALEGRGRRFGLDVMRAIAVMCVIVAHSTPLFFAEWSNIRDVFKWFVNIGTIGVDIFFALSGYLIGAILLRTMERFDDFAIVKRFLYRRWLRTLPAAYVSAIVVWFVAAPKNISDYVMSILFVGSFNAWRLSTENTFWWSLSTEELFYLLFPLLLFLLIKKLPRARAFAVTIILFAGFAMLSRVVLSWALPIAIIDNIQNVSYACLDAMVWGILMQWVRQSRPAWFIRLSQIGFAPGAVIFAAGAALLLDPLRWIVLTWFVCHILIVIGAVLMIPAMESIKTLGWRALDRVVGWIALISYSLYLYQCMMSNFVFYHNGYATSWGMAAQSLVWYFGLTFLAATMSYYGVEAPVLRWRDRRVTERESA